MCSESVTATLQPLFEDCCVAPFIPLAHQVGLERRSEEQIISRVGVENPLLFSLIRRMTDDYPFHVIPYVFVFLPIHCVVVAAVPETGRGHRPAGRSGRQDAVKNNLRAAADMAHALEGRVENHGVARHGACRAKGSADVLRIDFD